MDSTKPETDEILIDACGHNGARQLLRPKWVRHWCDPRWTTHAYQCCIYSVSQKQYIWLLIIPLASVDRCTKFFHCQIPEKILCTYIIKILYLTLSIFLHNLVKLENYNCCRFQWHIAGDTSEFIL